MIKVYSTPVCPYCEMLKDYLSKREIKFESVDVTESKEAQEEMIQKSNQMGVPVIDIDGEVIVGFNRSEIERVLKEKNLM